VHGRLKAGRRRTWGQDGNRPGRHPDEYRSSIRQISSRDPDQCRDLGSCVFDHVGRRVGDEFGTALDPGQASHLIGQHDPGYTCTVRNRHLERVPLACIRHRACDAQSDTLIVAARTQNQRRPSSLLLTPRGRIEIDPNELPCLRTIAVTRPRPRRAAPTRRPSDGSPR
jgi:hypothetical protein